MSSATTDSAKPTIAASRRAGRVLVHGVGRLGVDGGDGVAGADGTGMSPQVRQAAAAVRAADTVGRLLKLQEPNCVFSSWSTGVTRPRPGW